MSLNFKSKLRFGSFVRMSLFFSLAGLAVVQTHAGGQEDPERPRPKVLSAGGQSATTLQSINEEYSRRLVQIERQRLQELKQLAAHQKGDEASETYLQFFQLAIVNDLFKDAEPVAEEFLKSGNTSPNARFLAHTIDVIGAADRGAYDDSLADLKKALGVKTEGAAPEVTSVPQLDTVALLGIVDAYYQRLVQADQFDVAKKAFTLIQEKSENPALKAFCAERLYRLDQVGKPAPALKGADLDGKTVNLAELKGNVVLIIFWASWCVPNSTEVAALESIYSSHRDRGLRIIGINVDTLQKGSATLETLLPNIRRFILDHNVPWPNLINGTGDHDYVKAYGIASIPSNVLVGRDGSIVDLDLTQKHFLATINKALTK